MVSKNSLSLWVGDIGPATIGLPFKLSDADISMKTYLYIETNRIKPFSLITKKLAPYRGSKLGSILFVAQDS